MNDRELRRKEPDEFTPTSGSAVSDTMIQRAEAAQQVDKWNASEAGKAWFASQVKRAFKLHQSFEADYAAWREDCRGRVERCLRDGRLKQPPSDPEDDARSKYVVSGVDSPETAALAKRARRETLSEEDRQALCLALLRIITLAPNESDSWDYGFHARQNTASGAESSVSYGIWIELDDPPVHPMHATGTHFARLPRPDRVAIAATLLASLHACEMPDQARLPSLDDTRFDFSLPLLARDLEGVRLIGMLNLVESELVDGTQHGVVNSQVVVQTPWSPLPGYVAGSKIRREDGTSVPPSTIHGWRHRYPDTFSQNPSTGEWFHPIDWVKERLRKYRPGHNPPSRNDSPKVD